MRPGVFRTFIAAFIAFIASGACAETQERALPTSRGEVLLSFAPVVKKAQPAVVNVFASRVENMPVNPFYDDPIFRRFFGEGGPGGRRTALQTRQALPWRGKRGPSHRHKQIRSLHSMPQRAAGQKKRAARG